MAHPYWPLFDLELRIGDQSLRPMTEADLLPLAQALPDDVELDPSATRFEGLPEQTSRGLVGFQHYWRSYGTWSPEHWRLNFCVRASGQLVGVQELEGVDFPSLRTMDSSSHLIESARGQGIGKQMRRAVLAFGFGPLRAEAAVTSAWQDNLGSLGVSRALGYQDNGISLLRRDDRVGQLRHLRLTRADWLAASAAGAGATGVQLTGVEPCLPYFGLAEQS